MPIANVKSAVEVENGLNDILDGDDAEKCIGSIRALFTETLDWQRAEGPVPVHSARDDLPSDARLIASRDGISAVYLPLENADRVPTAAVSAAARSLKNTLADELLLLFTNRTHDEFHIVRTDLTNSSPRLRRMVARRGEHNRAIAWQFTKMWQDYERGDESVHDAVVSAFSAESMAERFYSEYRRIIANAKNCIQGFTDESELDLFTQTLLSRLIFVHFISRKGWFTYEGSTDYLNELWHSYRSEALLTNFYRSRLEPLFFDGLNNPQSPDVNRIDPTLHANIGDVPFLGGGLFQKDGRLDGREGVYVPDDAIEPIITGMFGRFDFTITKSTLDDTEVAVDPELLGMVFEELVNERHDRSGYYTPRPVVSFMCREALKGFLSKAHTGLSDETIVDLVDGRNTRNISVADASAVEQALERVTVVDPACGSGAYLLGMMRELAGLRAAFNDVGMDTKSSYDLKLEIIRRNLYGADLDNFAVNLVKFRLWLSLVIEDEGDEPEPLPNLDFKIACGDSLLSRDPQENSAFLAHLARESGVADMKANLMEARTKAVRDRLRTEIAETQASIRSALGGTALSERAIDWQAEFPEVMGDGGFDIVISSPPHLRHQCIENKTDLVLLYGEAVTPRSDLYCYFYARGLQLLRDGGMHVFACSSGWLDTGYGAKLQEHSAEDGEHRGDIRERGQATTIDRSNQDYHQRYQEGS